MTRHPLHLVAPILFGQQLQHAQKRLVAAHLNSLGVSNSGAGRSIFVSETLGVDPGAKIAKYSRGSVRW
jgi:hypothetical protein